MSSIIVKNLPQTGVNKDDLKRHFADIGDVTDVKLKFNDYGTFRRFAFIGFKCKDAAGKAADKLNSSYIKSSKIIVEPCKSIKDIRPDRVMSTGRHQSEMDKLKSVQQEDSKAEEGVEQRKKKRVKINDMEQDETLSKLKDDPEFKEFMSLQMNVGENIKSKHIWSDDAKMDAENLSIPEQQDQSRSEGLSAKSVGQTKLENEVRPRKRHKRSRPKKKKGSDKIEPKEIFEYTMKVKGIPENTRRKDVTDFFKPLELLSIRLSKKDRICYVSFKDESDLKYALRKDMQFWNTSRIKCVRHNVKKSKLFKKTVEERKREREEVIQKQRATLEETEPVEESGRLFIRNLNYNCTQEDIEQLFTGYGELTEVHFPIDKTTSMPKGYAYVEFMFPQNAAKAYEELNGTIFQGRNFHIIPSKPKPEPKFNGIQPRADIGARGNQSSFKKDRLVQQKQTASKGSNWNILFLGQNALADVVSEARNVEKSKLLTQQSRSDPIAVRMALGDAIAVEEMRKFLISNGVELDSFDNPQAPRSKTVILVKNLPRSVDRNELEQLFQPHGRVGRVIMPPNGLTAIVEMEEPVEAKLAFKKLAYMKFKDTILYLEWAPVNVFREKSLVDQEQDEVKQMEQLQTGTKILVKNVPFEATMSELKKIFAAFGELNFVRLPKKIDGQHRGFGFVDYLTKDDALRAFRSLCHSTHLYGRKLVLEWAKTEESSNVSTDPTVVNH